MVDVYVIGGGLPELAAALELAEVGLSVRLTDWQPESPVSDATVAPGRTVAHREPRGALPDPEGVLRELLQHIAAPIAQGGHANAAVRAVAVAPKPVLLRGAKGGWVPQPVPAALGIPAVPISSQAVAVIGGGAAARAYLDRVKPVLTIGKVHSLGELVRSRMGQAVVTKLVDPFVRERFGLTPDDVEVAAALPGLNEALTRAGSLSGGVLANSDRDVARETGVVPETGWPAAFEELRHRLELYEAQHASAPVSAFVSGADDTWRIEEADGTVVEARAIVTGVDAVSARGALLAAHEPLRELLPRRWRVQADVAVAAAPAEVGEHAALTAVELADGEHWAIRIERDAEGAHRARLSGPVFESEADRDALAKLDRVAAEVLAALGLTQQGAVEAQLRLAPYSSTELREAAEARLASAREAAPTLLPVGEALHGGSLATAVADARTQAVLLRRRLAGIAD